MKHEKLLNLLALINANGIGDVMAKKLISHCGSATQIFTEKRQALSKISGVGSAIIYALKDKTIFTRAEKNWIYNTHKFIFLFSDDDILFTKHCFDALFLF